MYGHKLIMIEIISIHDLGKSSVVKHVHTSMTMTSQTEVNFMTQIVIIFSY